jgi:hypothetical protein
MDKVGVEGDASKSRTFLLSYLWLPVRGAAAASSDIVTCCNLHPQAPAMYYWFFTGPMPFSPPLVTLKKDIGKHLKAAEKKDIPTKR